MTWKTSRSVGSCLVPGRWSQAAWVQVSALLLARLLTLHVSLAGKQGEWCDVTGGLRKESLKWSLEHHGAC